MKAYIATKFQNVDKFKEIETLINTKGYTITTDWTEHQSVKPFSDYEDLCKRQSYEDIEGIKEADLFLFYFDGERKGSGMFFELGFAVAQKLINNNKRVCVFGPNVGDTSMFMYVDEIEHFETIEDIIESL